MAVTYYLDQSTGVTVMYSTDWAVQEPVVEVYIYKNTTLDFELIFNYIL